MASSSQVNRRRNRPAGRPDPTAEVIALSPRRILDMEAHICYICYKGFNREQNLQVHFKSHNLLANLQRGTNNGSRNRVYVCPVPTCIYHHPSRALSDITGIKKHFSRKHSKVKKWKCGRCSKLYAIECDLKAHMKRCKFNVAAPVHLCDGDCADTSSGIHSSYCKAMSRQKGKSIGGEDGLKGYLPRPSVESRGDGIRMGGEDDRKGYLPRPSVEKGDALRMGGAQSNHRFTPGPVLALCAPSSRQQLPPRPLLAPLNGPPRFPIGNSALAGSSRNANEFTLPPFVDGLTFKPILNGADSDEVVKGYNDTVFSIMEMQSHSRKPTPQAPPLMPYPSPTYSMSPAPELVQSLNHSITNDTSNSFFSGLNQQNTHQDYHVPNFQSNHRHVQPNTMRGAVAPFPYPFNVQTNINGFINPGINNTMVGEIQPEKASVSGGGGELSHDRMLAAMEEAMGLGAGISSGPLSGFEDDSMF